MFAYSLSIFVLNLSRFTDAVIPAKHQSTCILCATDTNAIRWRRSTSLLSLLQHTMKMQPSDWTWDCANINAETLADYCTRFHWNRCIVSVLVQFVTILAGQNCFCLAVLFFTDADIKCASLLCHVTAVFVWNCVEWMDASCCFVCTKLVLFAVVHKLEVAPELCSSLFTPRGKLWEHFLKSYINFFTIAVYASFAESCNVVAAYNVLYDFSAMSILSRSDLHSS